MLGAVINPSTNGCSVIPEAVPEGGAATGHTPDWRIGVGQTVHRAAAPLIPDPQARHSARAVSEPADVSTPPSRRLPHPPTNALPFSPTRPPMGDRLPLLCRLTEGRGLDRLNGLLRRLVRKTEGRDAEPSACVLDAQSITTSADMPAASPLKPSWAGSRRVTSTSMPRRAPWSMVGVAGVGPGPGDAGGWPAFGDVREQVDAAGVVGDAGGGDEYGQEEAERFDADVAFAACDLLGRIDAPRLLNPPHPSEAMMHLALIARDQRSSMTPAASRQAPQVSSRSGSRQKSDGDIPASWMPHSVLSKLPNARESPAWGRWRASPGFR